MRRIRRRRCCRVRCGATGRGDAAWQQFHPATDGSVLDKATQLQRAHRRLYVAAGLRAWLNKNAPAELLKSWEDGAALAALPESAPLRKQLLGWAARYLGGQTEDGRPLDPVARFHLGNGARVERIHWGADPSAKGSKQSFGLMVNYLYDLKRLDKHRAQLAEGKIPIAGAIEALYL